MPRWIGIDYGTRRIGLALADYSARLASPAATIPAAGDARTDARQLLTWATAHEPGGFVVGLPLNMDGTDSRQTRLARDFAAALQALTPLPVELWDERLSSFQADQYLAAAGLTPGKTKGRARPSARRRRQRALRDAVAAQVILQSFIDARRDA